LGHLNFGDSDLFSTSLCVLGGSVVKNSVSPCLPCGMPQLSHRGLKNVLIRALVAWWQTFFTGEKTKEK
jgi:hypothetical protein